MSGKRRSVNDRTGTSFLSAAGDMPSAAEGVGEIPAQVFEASIGRFFTDAYIAAVHYRLTDASETAGDVRFTRYEPVRMGVMTRHLRPNI
jgi:hypothetical protein